MIPSIGGYEYPAFLPHEREIRNLNWWITNGFLVSSQDRPNTNKNAADPNLEAQFSRYLALSNIDDSSAGEVRSPVRSKPVIQIF